MKQISRYLSVFFLAIAVASLIGCAPTATTQAPGEYLDDSVITTKVKTAIFNDPDLKLMEISVETFRGVVQLSGFVSSQTAANRAVQVAQRVGGVQSVRNDMQIR